MSTMVYGTIDSIVNDPPPEPREERRAQREGLPAEIPTSTVTVSFEDPHSGSMTLKLNTAATGGLAEGKVRVILDAA